MISNYVNQLISIGSDLHFFFGAFLTLNTERTSNDIIAGDGRERFVIELKFIEKCVCYGAASFLTNCFNEQKRLTSLIP